ncbi:hypothetical protein BS50DRAFT_665304 [Corynespora cassiicola Philippines]|uniref:Uncharacterized protein n=1 Tax=Corynespora cassiicola Philippines TaxID=1448308 RepID=A0A2T2NR17_CORCC|nr:hypothetical protein BS50DRAFT_665304 [Corynespora cassiicola Philippines]
MEAHYMRFRSKYWNDPDGQTLLFFATVICISTIWLALLSISRKKSEPNKKDNDKDFHKAPIAPNHHLPSDTTSTPSTPSTTTTSRQLYFYSETPVPVPRGAQISTPGSETLFADAFNTRNFSILARHAPDSYATLQQAGFLDRHGTPTKKAVDHTRQPWVRQGLGVLEEREEVESLGESEVVIESIEVDGYEEYDIRMESSHGFADGFEEELADSRPEALDGYLFY